MVERELKENLGKNIKFLRFRKQFSQADLAEKANISITFLSNVERGNYFPKASTLCNLASALGVQVWELFRGEGALDEQEENMVDRISDDLTRHINVTIETIRKQYKT